MKHAHFSRRHRSAQSLALVIMIGSFLAGCATTAEQRQAELNEDMVTCANFGSRYGSAQHTQCMLIQQQRRDGEALAALERARIASEISRNTQEMIDARKEEAN